MQSAQADCLICLVRIICSLSAQTNKFLKERDRLHVASMCKKWFYPIIFSQHAHQIITLRVCRRVFFFSKSSSLCSLSSPSWWMKDNHALLSTSVYIHVVLSFRQEHGLPLFLPTGHLSPLESTIDVLLYQSVFHHLWTVEKRNPIVLHNQPHCTHIGERNIVLFWVMCC